MICTSCITTFFHDPVKIGIAIASILLSLIFLYYSRKITHAKKKIGFVYAHIFFLIFPVFFYIFFSGCSTVLNSCHQLAPLLLILVISILSSLALASVVGPILFIKRNINNSHRIEEGFLAALVKKYAKKMGIRPPQLYLIDTATPRAFSLSAIKTKIFISIGLADILNKRELEAVLLHELGHIKNKSSVIKFWSFFAKTLSPLETFATARENITQEEIKADQTVLHFQQSTIFLNTAKKKINDFLAYRAAEAV